MSTLLFDFENLVLRCLYGAKEVNADTGDINYDMLEYLVFNSISSLLFKERVNEVILALDSKSWRKLIYPNYKADRKKKKEESKINWDEFHNWKHNFLDEVKNNLPFKVLYINKAEADDIIGTLVLNDRLKDCVIVSMDSDYLQLCNKCRIYNPIKKEYRTPVNPEKFLFEAAVLGQKKDYISNSRTPLDWPDWKKRPPFGEKGLEKLLLNNELDSFLDTEISYFFKNEETQEEYSSTILPRKLYELNLKLIDLKCTPNVIKDAILNQYDTYTMDANPNDLYLYFTNKKWNEVLENFNKIESKLLELF